MADPMLIARAPDQFKGHLPCCRHGQPPRPHHRRHRHRQDTVTLQKLAESFANIGVPVFVADVKGDLSGIGAAGRPTKLMQRLAALGIDDYARAPTPWCSGTCSASRPPGARHHLGHGAAAARAPAQPQRHPGRRADAGVQDRRRQRPAAARPQGPARHGPVRGRERQDFTTEYGNISAASIGAIQRNLLALEEQGGDVFFGEPMLDINDLMQTDADGRGVINVLAADKLYHSPKLYSTFLLWMLSELFEQLPEVGDPDKPKDGVLLRRGPPAVSTTRPRP